MTQQYYDPRNQFEPKNPAMVQFIMDLGLAKDPKTANIILLVLIVAFFGVSVYLFFSVL